MARVKRSVNAKKKRREVLELASGYRGQRSRLYRKGMTYNRFINGLKNAGVEVDRKILADLAVNDTAAFNALVAVAKDNQSVAAA